MWATFSPGELRHIEVFALLFVFTHKHQNGKTWWGVVDHRPEILEEHVRDKEPPHLPRQKTHVHRGWGSTWTSLYQGHQLSVSREGPFSVSTKSSHQSLWIPSISKAMLKSSLLSDIFRDLLCWNFHGFSSPSTFLCLSHYIAHLEFSIVYYLYASSVDLPYETLESKGCVVFILVSLTLLYYDICFSNEGYFKLSPHQPSKANPINKRRGQSLQSSPNACILKCLPDLLSSDSPPQFIFFKYHY